MVENRFELILSELDGGEIKSKSYPLTTSDLVHLDQVLVQYLQQFLFETQHELNHLITFPLRLVASLIVKID